MQEKPHIETIFGAILLQPTKRKQLEIFTRIDITWCKESFHKHLYSAFDSILKTGTDLDLLSVTRYFRENAFKHDMLPLKISKLTDISALDINLYLDNIFYECLVEQAVDSTLNFCRTMEQQITAGTFSLQILDDTVKKLGSISKTFSRTDQTLHEITTEVLADHEKAKTATGPMGVELPFRQLKNVVLLESVDMMVVGARPAMGKTAFAVSLAVDLAKQNKKIVFFALEMTKKQITRRILANATGINSNKMKYGMCTDEELMAIATVSNSYWFNNIILYDGSKNVMQISNDMLKERQKNKIDLFIVDYLQKIQPRTHKSRYEGVTEISNGLKLISQNMETPSICLAQLSRDSSRTGKRPTLPDLKESGEIEQDASVVAFLHRPEYYGETETINGNNSKDICELIIGKNREGEIGLYELDVNLETSKFYETIKPAQPHYYDE
jgi:replicative DNA helicase